jgi:hypothetical protein
MFYDLRMFELRLAVTLDKIVLQYRTRPISKNPWGDIRVGELAEWEDVPTVNLTEEKK